MACAGGILALLVARTNFSISAAMGFISIFGISVQDALIVVTERAIAKHVCAEKGMGHTKGLKAN